MSKKEERMRELEKLNERLHRENENLLALNELLFKMLDKPSFPQPPSIIWTTTPTVQPYETWSDSETRPLND